MACEKPCEEPKPPKDYRDQWVGNYNFEISFTQIIPYYPPYTYKADTFRSDINSAGNIEKHENNSIKIILSKQQNTVFSLIYATVDSTGNFNDINSEISHRSARGSCVNNDSIVLYFYNYSAAGVSYSYNIYGKK
jgi:hypothetical protein